MKNPNDRPFLTVKEVSALLGISVSTINRLIKNDKFPPKIKLSPGRKVFFRNHIEEWINERHKN